MKAKFFQTIDPMYHKKVEAVNIILTPEEKESFKTGLDAVGEDIDTGPKLKKFLRTYKPYEPENEHKDYPNGAFNTVIFEDMYIHAFMDLVYLISLIGEMEKTITLLKENKELNDQCIQILKETVATQKLHIEYLQNQTTDHD